MYDCPQACPHLEITFYWVTSVVAVALGCGSLALCIIGKRRGTVSWRDDSDAVEHAHFSAYIVAIFLWCALAAIAVFFWATCALSADVSSSSAFFSIALAYGVGSFALLGLSFGWTLLAHCGGSAEDDPYTALVFLIQFLVAVGAIVLAVVGGWADLPPSADGNVWRKWSDELCVDNRCAGTPSSIDACGICMGDNSTCAGCDGIPASGVTTDACGVCGGDGSTCASCMQVTAQHTGATWVFIGVHLFVVVLGIAILWRTFVERNDLLGIVDDGASDKDVVRLLRHKEGWDAVVMSALSVVCAGLVILIFAQCSVSFRDAELWTLCKATLWVGTSVLFARWYHPVHLALATTYSNSIALAVAKVACNAQTGWLFAYIMMVWMPTCICFELSPARPAPFNIALSTTVGLSWICLGLWWARAVYIISKISRTTSSARPRSALLDSPRSLSQDLVSGARSSFGAERWHEPLLQRQASLDSESEPNHN